MRCKNAQFFLGGHLRGELAGNRAEQLRNHLRQCPACKAALDFHVRLDQLAQPRSAPEELLERAIAMHRNKSKQAPWLAEKLGDPKLRKIFLSTAGVIGALAAFLTILPSLASAESPRKLFRSMKAAMKAQAPAIELIVVQPEKGGGVRMTSASEVKFTGTSADGAQNFTGNLDLNEEHYQSIEYGKAKTILILVPKEGEGKKIVVTVDEKSKVAKDWVSYAWDGTKYVKVGNYMVQPKRKKK